MSFFKLNQKGIVHHIAPLVIVVGLAIIGVGTYVGTHADTNTTCSGAPSAPTQVTPTSDVQTATNVGWVESKDPASCKITNYYVYRATDGSSTFSQVANIVATSSSTNANAFLTNIGLKPSTTYSYYVVAKNNSGATSKHSNIAAVITSSTSPANCTNRLFQVTDPRTVNICIKYAQVMLNSYNTYFTNFNNPTVNNGSFPPAQLTLDGNYGVSTDNQVQRWQYISGLNVDGDLGQGTWMKLCYWDARMWNSEINKDPSGLNIPAYILNAKDQSANASC